MVFPQTILPLKVELYLGSWTDVTSYVRRANGLNITRGRQNEAQQAERTQLTFTLENTDGRFSERNPTGPYYGLLSRNTPCRVSVTRDTKVLEMSGGSTDLVACPDAAALDITGDIDIRVDAHLHDWWTPTHLACKWRSVSGDHRSWALVAEDGYLRLWWSTGGTSATRTSVRSTATLPVTTGRLAVRVTLDVNNGASGNTATFYTSDSVSGTWTQLGSAVVTSGTTSIHSGTAAVEAGGYTEAGFTSLDTADLYGYTSVYGWMYAVQVRSGIAGTVVANPDFTIQDVADSSFPDTASSPNTWSVNSGANITDRWWRYHGEVSSWPQTWDITGRDVTVAVTASGPLRRLSQGPSPLRSVIHRSVIASEPLAYWPCEDQASATTIASALTNGYPMTFVGAPTMASYEGFPGSANILVCNDARFVGRIQSDAAQTALQLQFLIYIPEDGLADDYQDLISLVTTTFRFELEYDSPGSGGRFLLQGHPVGGSAPTTNAIANVNGTNMCVTITAAQDGADVDYSLSVYTLETGTSVTESTTETSGTLGQALHVTIGSGATSLTLDGVAIGHIAVRTSAADSASIASLLQGYSGEPAGTRFARLCTEAGITYRAIGELAATELMGPQRPVTLVELLKECAVTDLGMLFEPLDCLGLGFRTRRSIENQTPALLINYADHELASPPQPTPDDAGARNDYTVQRIGGSSSRQELTAGRMSTADPPDGVGRYPVQEAVSLASDAQVADQASIRLMFGTIDEERYPSVQVSRTTPAVVANSTLNNSLLAVNVGHKLAIDDMPSLQVAPGQVGQIIQGWVERLSSKEHSFVFNTTPATPWTFGLIEDDELGRFDTAGSELASSATSTATTLSVATTADPIWTYSAEEVPFDVTIGGEVITVDFVGQVLNSNPTFETNTTGWTATSAILTRSSTVAKKGSWSGLLTSTAGASPRVEASLVAATAGTVYRAVGWLYAPSTLPSQASINVNWFNAGSTYLSTSSNDKTLTAGVWTVYDTTFTAPANTAFASIVFSLVGTPGAGQLVFGDEIRLVPLTTYNASPQTFTVTRSVNGVVKAHSSGADVRLTHPLILSLGG